MQITDVRADLISIPLQQDALASPWIAGGFRQQILVTVETDRGLSGYGEAFAYGVPHATLAVVNETLKPMLVGEDPTQISMLQDRMYRQTHLFGRYGITTFGISGVDIALWDLAGKCANMPLYQLLGGAVVTEIPTYASLVRYSEPEHVRIITERALSEGYSAVKLHQIDVESLRRARDVAGEDAYIMMDINCAWTPEEAMEMTQLCEPEDLYWLEEPLWPPEDFEALAQLSSVSGMPIATGENACTVYQFRRLLEAGAATFIQPSVTKVGGVSEWRKIAALAEAYNVTIAPHSPYFGAGLLATAHLAAATPRAAWLEYLYVAPEASIFHNFVGVQEGFFTVPDGPGLGLEIDREVIERYCETP
jgi:L-alanine-DL-glutamate epimerase-like enolase superfamily enzyme